MGVVPQNATNSL